MSHRPKFGFVLVALQILNAILVILFIDYGQHCDGSSLAHSYPPFFGGMKASHNDIESHYSSLLSLQIFYVITLSFFLGSNEPILTSLGLNLMIFLFSIQWSMFLPKKWPVKFERISIDIVNLCDSVRLATGPMFSLAILAGTISPFQSIVVTFFVLPLISALVLFFDWLQVADNGGGMCVIMFGVYFGIGVATGLRLKYRHHDSLNVNKSTYTQQLIQLFSTCLLICTLPSILPHTTRGDRKHRTIINALVSMIGGCLISYGLSSMDNCDSERFNARIIMIGTASSGAIMSSIADLMLQPYWCLLIGISGATIGIGIHLYLQPFLLRVSRIYDQHSIHSCFGIPTIVSGILSSLMASIAQYDNYQFSLYKIYPARAPSQNTMELSELQSYSIDIQAGSDVSSSMQALYQLIGLFASLSVSLLTGFIVGKWILNRKFLDPIDTRNLFDDSFHWSFVASFDNDHSVTQSAESAI